MLNFYFFLTNKTSWLTFISLIFMRKTTDVCWAPKILVVNLLVFSIFKNSFSTLSAHRLNFKWFLTFSIGSSRFKRFLWLLVRVDISLHISILVYIDLSEDNVDKIHGKIARPKFSFTMKWRKANGTAFFIPWTDVAFDTGPAKAMRALEVHRCLHQLLAELAFQGLVEKHVSLVSYGRKRAIA